MKKNHSLHCMRIVFISLILAIVNVSVIAADDLGFGELSKTLNSFSKSKSATGAIPEGKEILPVIFAYLATPTDPKNIAFVVSLDSVNAVTNEYTIKQFVIYKFALSLQRQDTVIQITSDGSTFTVNVTKDTVYGADKNGNPTGEGIDSSNSTLTKMSKVYADWFTKEFAMSDDDYKKFSDEAYTNLDVLSSITNKSANKLKAKIWFKNHPVENKPITCNFMFVSIDESKEKGYAYELDGLYTVKDQDPILIKYYSNNDKLVEQKENTIVTAKGVIAAIDFSELIGYKISSVTIKE